MPEDHERIEELLAGYALRSLSGDDGEAADRLISEHVPSCPMCRDTLDGFQSIAGELALAAAPLSPPALLLPRIRRELGEAPARRRRFPMLAAAAGIAAVVAMGGLTLSQTIRTSHLQSQNDLLNSAIGLATQPGARRLPLSDRGQTSQGPLTEISAPGTEEIYLVGEEVPLPAPGNVYRVWFGAGGRFTFAGDFAPDPDATWTVLRLTIDPSRFDEILITEEAADSPRAAPSGIERWSATF